MTTPVDFWAAQLDEIQRHIDQAEAKGSFSALAQLQIRKKEAFQSLCEARDSQPKRPKDPAQLIDTVLTLIPQMPRHAIEQIAALSCTQLGLEVPQLTGLRVVK